MEMRGAAMQFQYVLRQGESLTNDKPSIFMYVSPEEESRYRELTDLFLSAINAVIYYPESGQISGEDRQWSRFNMFAVLVSDHLIRHGRNDFDALCAIAEKHKIPVFLFRISEISFEEFEAAHGCLHVFDATAKEDREGLTAQLRASLFHFLGSVEELEEIKKSFDVQFFLSYRKKDRDFVNTLLRVIHSHPLLRDSAIWFDDALTPGEDYQRAIETELSSSAWFLLLVTNSLLEKDNYVARVEYPMAKQLGKPMIPFRFETPDPAALLEAFPQLPACADIGDADSVTRALDEVCLVQNIQSQNNTPAHLYLIGLAYLWGIGVEKDEPLALSLLSDAAQMGYTEAWLRLGSIYTNGIGVEKDTAKAADFLEKYLFCKKDLATTPPIDFLNKKRLTPEEYACYITVTNVIWAMKTLVRLKIPRDIPLLTGLCKYCTECVGTYTLLTSKYSVIVGYETITDENGKRKLGREIFEDKVCITGKVTNKDMIDLLHSFGSC